jgi:hypothetical protein
MLKIALFNQLEHMFKLLTNDCIIIYMDMGSKFDSN